MPTPFECDSHYCLILLDLDGTTLQPDATLSERTCKAIAAVVAQGVLVVLASARPPRSMQPYYEELGLSSPLIAYNGALVVDGEGKTIFQQNLNPSMAREVVALLRERQPGANISLECDDIWHIDKVDDDLRTALLRFRIEAPHSEGRVDTVLLSDDLGITKVLFPCGDAVLTLAAEFQEAFGQRATCIPTGDLVEIVAEGVSKGAAAARLCDHLNISPHNVIAMGNDYNDVPMLEFAGLAIAVDNAPDGVKEVAHHIAPPNWEDGVAVALEALLADGKLGRNDSV